MQICMCHDAVWDHNATKVDHNNLNKHCFSFTKAAISPFNHQDFFVPSHPPCSLTDLNSFFNQTFLEILPHIFDTCRRLHHQCSAGLHSRFENTCSYIISQLPNLASFHKFHLTLIKPFLRIQNTNDQFIIWNTLELLYAADLVSMAETEELLLEKLRKWKKGMEVKGLTVNSGW